MQTKTDDIMAAALLLAVTKAEHRLAVHAFAHDEADYEPVAALAAEFNEAQARLKDALEALVREAQAEAWDEGSSTAMLHPDASVTGNPYKAADHD